MSAMRIGAAVLGLLAAGTTSLSVAAAPVAKPTATVVWRGMASDVVGRLKDAKGNGERDGHFTATLSNAGGRVVTQIAIQRVFKPKGYAESWDTNPGTSASILAVLAGGKRLNPIDRDVSYAVSSAKSRTFELYANEIGSFAPGQCFRVWFWFKDGSTASGDTILPGAQATLSASFAGLGGDVVGAGVDQKPNGQPDAHFTALLDTHGAWRILNNVSLRHLTPRGALDLPIYWLQGPNTAGLLVDGKRYLWPSGLRNWIFVYVPLAPRPAPLRLDVYANDPTPKGAESLFRPGERWRLTVDFTDTTTFVTKPVSVDVTT